MDSAEYINPCNPGYTRCAATGVEVCRQDGSGFDALYSCEDGTVCLDMACIPMEQAREISGANGQALKPSHGSDAGQENTEDNTVFPTQPEFQFQGFQIEIRFQITEATEGGYLDIGLCEGTPVADASGPPLCEGGLFLRVKQTGLGVVGELFQHQEEALEPLLFAPIPLETSEVYTLSFSSGLLPEEGLKPVTGTLMFRGVFSNSMVQLPLEFSREMLSAIGVWNFEDSGTKDQAMSATLASVSITSALDNPSSIQDFQALASENNIIITSPPEGTFLSFYVDDSAASWMLLAIEPFLPVSAPSTE